MAEAGHRTLPHPADVILQAWAPTPQGCLAEAVFALVEAFADTSHARPTSTHEFDVTDAEWAERLVSVLEEALLLLDARGQVPLTTSVQMAPAGGLAVSFEVAGVDDVEVTGSTPKGIARSGLEFRPHGDCWHCSAIVDV